jgi:carbamoyltransferase
VLPPIVTILYASFIPSRGGPLKPLSFTVKFLTPCTLGQMLESISWMVLDNCKTRYHWHNGEGEKIDATLRLLEGGKIVAWYQGQAEFGPRALGNRSLLASPWAPYVKENLNEYVKHREAFRPFAIAVPEEDCGQYFDCSPAGRFMATIAWARPTARGLLEGFPLPGDRLRLHIVDRHANPLFWRLLKRFGERAPAPLLVNTSFKLFGEPLVVSPRDAVRSFFCSGINGLVIGNFSVIKN